MPNKIKLKGQAERRNAPYDLGEIPATVALSIGRDIVHRLAIGMADITGDDFGGIFANAIGGAHRAKPLGIADVTWNGCAWSIKTVKASKPFTQPAVRLITGRNSPTFSAGIENYFEDVQATGAAVLSVWNARVNESLNEHDDLRIFVIMRNIDTLEFTLFEFEAVRFITRNYNWEVNSRGNFEGYDLATGAHVFTWQPHGAQFTVLHHVPPSAYRFRIKQRPMMLEVRHVLQLARFKDDWIVPVRLVKPDSDA